LAWDLEDIGIRFTSVENPIGLIGRRAGAMAIDRAMDPTLPREIVKLTPRLVLGQTTAAPPASS
jgi:DNA-binding LacI/PurR family transcriptional regulator